MNALDDQYSMNDAGMKTVHRVVLNNAASILSISRRTAELFGRGAENLGGRSFLTLVSRHFHSAFNDVWLDFIDRQEARSLRINGIHSGGFEIPLDMGFNYRETGDEPEFSVEFRDISYRGSLEQELSALRENYILLAETATDVILQIDGSLEILFVNSAVKRIFGYEREEVEREHLGSLFAPGPFSQYEEILKKYFVIDDADRKENGLPNTLEVLGRRKDGDFIPLEVSLGNSRGIGDNRILTCIVRDISLRKKAERRLKYLAYHDKLTSLGNRDRFHETLNRVLEGIRNGEGRYAALLYLDLDGFKKVNDSMGHEIGDVILKACAGRLSNCLREGDQVYRIQLEDIFRVGGDEFTILLPVINDPEDAAIVANRVIGSITQPFSIDGWGSISNVSLGVSIGIAVVPKDGEDGTTLLRNADTAMYRAKERGNSFRFFTEDMNSKAIERVMIEEGLRGALSKEELTLVYHPIVDERGDINSFEALVRWNHPERGLISPDGFIPIAEDTGLIIPMGKWILMTACRHLKMLHERGFGSLQVSVNVSPMQLQEENMGETVREILEKEEISPSSVILELTETAIMNNPDMAIAKMEDIKRINQGIRIAIDDFGTGYSSLSYLSLFPVDHLKVDKSFVMNLDRGNNSKITRTIISLGQNLGLKVVAEGVETAEQAGFLRDKGCHYFQGNLFSVPLRFEALEELLSRESPYAGEINPR